MLLAYVTYARGAALELYETGAPDLGTASAGRAAMASDASTAAANPAGMTQLDRTQLLTASGALLPFTNFDLAPQTTTKGTAGGNAGVFSPWGAFFYVYKLSERVRLGVALYSDYGLAVDYSTQWAGRYYATRESLFSGKLAPSIAYALNDWLSVGGRFQLLRSRDSSRFPPSIVIPGLVTRHPAFRSAGPDILADRLGGVAFGAGLNRR